MCTDKSCRDRGCRRCCWSAFSRPPPAAAPLLHPCSACPHKKKRASWHAEHACFEQCLFRLREDRLGSPDAKRRADPYCSNLSPPPLTSSIGVNLRPVAFAANTLHVEANVGAASPDIATPLSETQSRSDRAASAPTHSRNARVESTATRSERTDTYDEEHDYLHDSVTTC